MGDVALGVTTVFHWSAAGDRPGEQGVRRRVEEGVRRQRDAQLPLGRLVGRHRADLRRDQAAEGQARPGPARWRSSRRSKNPNSPRGPISIDPETRDIIQPEYLREVRKVDGQLANVELETLGTAVKDPWKELQKSRAAEEVSRPWQEFLSVCRKRRLPRRRLRHDPVRHLRRPVGDDGPDGLRQPRARRVRHGRAASSSPR